MKTVLLLTLASVATAQQFDRNVTFSGVGLGTSWASPSGDDSISLELTPNSYCGVKYLALPYKVACKVEAHLKVVVQKLVLFDDNASAWAGAELSADFVGGSDDLLQGKVSLTYGAQTPRIALPVLLQSGVTAVAPRAPKLELAAQTWPSDGKQFSLTLPVTDIAKGICLSSLKDTIKLYAKDTPDALTKTLDVVSKGCKLTGSNICARVDGLKKTAEEQTATLKLLVSVDFLNVEKMDFSVILATADADTISKAKDAVRTLMSKANISSFSREINVGAVLSKFLQDKLPKKQRRLSETATVPGSEFVTSDGQFAFGYAATTNAVSTASPSMLVTLLLGVLSLGLFM